MLKTICVCNRCGKTFDEKDSKTIKIVSARSEREKQKNENPTEGLFFGFFKAIQRAAVKDYCPECINKINDFILNEGGAENENGSD